jgi:biotin carboxyl carrier protein
MKLKAEIGSESCDVEIKLQDRRLIADVDGRAYDIEISEPEPNIYLFKREGRIYQAFVSPEASPTGEISVSVGNSQFNIRLIDPKRLHGAASDSAGTDGPAEIRTAMPGKIVRVLVETGEEVAKGQGVIVVEAMKMQNELKSPRNGIVKEILFGVDTTVSSGDVLVTID